MKSCAKTWVVLLLVMAGCGCSEVEPTLEHEPSVAAIAEGYTTYRQITKSEVYVDPELAMLCVGASKKQVEQARIGFGPHAHTSILVYMNKPAAETFATNGSLYPVGSVIVKRKSILGYHDGKGKPIAKADNGVGGMVKRPVGYDSQHGDWEYFYFEDSRKMESGRIETCVQCHSSAKSKDYVFGTWREEARSGNR